MFKEITYYSKCQLTCKSQKTLNALCLSSYAVLNLWPKQTFPTWYQHNFSAIRVNCIIQSCCSLCSGDFIFMLVSF